MTKSPPNQTIRPALWCLTGLVVGGLSVAGIGTAAHHRLAATHDRLQAKLTALHEQHTEALRRLEDLNAQVASLREQATQQQGPGTHERKLLATGAELPGVGGAAVASGDQPPPWAAGRLTLEGIPAQVQAAVVRQAGQLDISQLDLLTEDGQLIYQVQGLTSDGRRVGLRLTPDGRIVSGKSEITVEALPNAVREAVAQTWGEVNVHNAREILQKNQAVYELGGQLPDGRKLSVSLAAGGALLSAETEVFPANLPQPVHNAIAGIVNTAANPVIKEVYADERFTYHVGVKTETEKASLVVGQDGTLVGYEKWFRPLKKPSD